VSGAYHQVQRVTRAAGLWLALAATGAVSSARAIPPARPQSQSGDLVFELDPADTKVSFTLGATMHTVHGTFQPLRGRVEYTEATGALHGEIVVDAASGASGDASRDRKMHAEILESENHPAITFRPDHAEGKLAAAGESTVQVHGIFAIHGAEHELTVPATVKLDGKNWTATAHFAVPYVQWGMKNPSVFFLRVSKTVDVEIAATGTVSPASR
jgi:polyisoprenoid-binding protein YceI